MKNEKTRGTMLTSTALILCCVTFGAGFLCGDLVSEYRRAGAPAASVQAPQAVQHQPAAEAPQDAEARAASHIAELREQVKKSPDDASLWTHLGNLCYDSGKFDEAIEAYGRSLALAPGDPNVITDMGSMYRMKGQGAEAVKYYEQAIAIKPDHANAVFNKGVTLLLDMERPEEAMAFWQSVLEKQPHFALGNGAHLHSVIHELASDAGVQLEAHGRYETALRAYAEALKVKPDFLPALVHRAWLLEQTGRAGEALPLWKKVVELSPEATDPAGKPVRDRIR
jgi:tetratricopeptide (TPR) repeat protein